MHFQVCFITSSVLCVLLLALTHSASAGLTDYVRPCSAKDPQLNECAMSRARSMWPQLVKGIKELGLVPMEPLFIPLVQVQEGQAETGRGLDINLTNTKHYGWKNGVIKDLKMDPLNHHFEFDLFFPKYNIIGNYQIKGRILVLPISGQGFSNISIENVATKLVMDGKTEMRHGKKYLKLTDVKAKLAIGKANLNMDNLFGNKELSDGMNRFLNDNANEVFSEFQPAFEDVIGQLYWGMIANFFRKVPYDKLFMDMN